jgi:hypothetical protein
MISVILVKCELASVMYTVNPIGILRLRIRKFVDDILDVRDSTLEALVYLSERALDIRNLALALESLSFENDLAAVSVCIGDGLPDADCIRMLLRSIDLHLYREVVILSENILYRVDIVLSHISETATVIIPIATESIMSTMSVIWLIRSWSEPEVIVKSRRDRLRNEILLSSPEELPCEACRT